MTPLPPPYRERGLPAEALWEHFAWFWRRVVPAAAEAGVRLALHPDDPPTAAPLGGAGRIVSSLAAYRRIFDLAPGAANAMLFCQGCVQEMGVDVYAAIGEMAAQSRIALVHFRTVRGTPHHFAEVFVDEGDVDMHRAMEAYRDAGYRGPFLLDHLPQLDPPFDQWHGRAFSNGYIKALLQVVYR